MSFLRAVEIGRLQVASSGGWLSLQDLSEELTPKTMSGSVNTCYYYL